MDKEVRPPESGSIPVVMLLLATNIIAYFVLSAGGTDIGLQHFALWPMAPESAMELPAGVSPGSFQPWQLVTYAFLHGNLLHLLINMFVLWMFGGPIERTWGSSVFALYYFVCVIGAGVVQLLISSSGMMDPAPSLGASGGVFGILLAFGMLFPNQTVVLLIPPIPMKAKYFVILIGIVELIFGVTGTQQGVANFAHLAGLVFGFVFIMLFRGRLRWPG